MIDLRPIRSLQALAFLCLALSVFAAGRAGAESRKPPPLDDMYHRSWTVHEGVPSGLWQARQTADGFLWLSAETGLYRFDGIEFTKYHPPQGQKLLKEGPVTALAPTADGGLWIAYRFGGASFLLHGVVTNYPASQEFPQTIFALVQDGDGTLWGATDSGLVRFDGKCWGQVNPSWGPAISRVDHLLLAPGGDLWVDDGKTYYVLRHGSSRFQPTGLPNGKLDFTDEHSGWLARDGLGLFPVARSADETWLLGKQILRENISSITHTPDGSVWFGAHDGIWRVRGVTPHHPQVAPGALQAFQKSDGLTSDFVYALTTDQEGSLWAITPNGLDQFRRSSFHSVALPPGMQHPFLINEGSNVLFASAFHAPSMLVRVSPSGTQSIPTPFTNIHQIYRDPTGTVWISADGKLWRLTENRLTSLPVPEDLAPSDLKIRAITLDHTGALWVSVITAGPDKLYRFSQQRWNSVQDRSQTSGFEVTSMMTDSTGHIWAATDASHIHVIDGATTRTFGPEQGVDSGGITLLQQEGDHVWIGGTENLDYFSHGRFRRVSFAGGSPIAGVTGVAETPNRDVWLNSASGVVRVEAAEMEQALHSETPRVHGRIFNDLDGVLETPIVRLQASTVARTTNGRLYVLGRQGLAWIDPSRLENNQIPPGVFITSAAIDGHTEDTTSLSRLNQHAQSLQINYTATSLLIPSRVRFRYKLQGFDKAWQEVGTRRQAFYTHLPPGRYTFLVAASNDDGVWSTQTAHWDFALPPTFLQSIWFKLLCVLAIAALLTGLYLLRINLLTDRIQSRLFERLAERERIARDLHDTFFQSIQGLFLRFNTGTSLLPFDEPARQIFLEALEHSDRVMSEGRELVLDLRADSAVIADLAEDLARIGDQPSAFRKPDFKVFSVGQVRRLHPVCGTELLRIGREAVYNAFRHAEATAVEVEVLYEKDALRLRIRDDGQGIDEDVIRQGKREGHLGLVGMSERATSIGARYRIWSKIGRGTEVEVDVPAEIAYVSTNSKQRASGTRK